MRQKVALTAAHLLCEGDVADMGMGSGTGSHALASLYPELRVVGVDVNPTMVQRAQERHVLPNLRFVEGDIAKPCFEPGTMEAILNSSVLHHVTSFSGYDRGAAARAMAVQVTQLADRGVLIVRDFVDPGPGTVWLDVSATDGADDATDPTACSTAALLERFATEFRALSDTPGFACKRVERGPPIAEGFVRFELAHTHAVEFVLRKDYRKSWDVEVQEEYTYATQSELESICANLGLRVLASTPIHNPWIVNNRFRGKFKMWSTEGEELEFPPTNFVIVGQKVSDDEGVRILEEEELPPLGYLVLSHYRDTTTDNIYDLARRPGMTLDVVPWFEQGGVSFVLARRSYPRPVVGANGVAPRIDGSTPSTYVTEPLIAMCTDKPIGQTVEDLLIQFPGIGSDGIRGFEPGNRYFPSPGGLQEQVESVFVAIDPVNVQEQLEVTSGFSTAGTLRAIETRQLLRAAQVGGLPDARLEMNAYELLHRHGRSPGAWIGEAVTLTERAPPEATRCTALLERPHRRVFRATDASAGFLEVRAARFAEQNAHGEVLKRQAREMVLPCPVSRNTVVVAAVRKCGDRMFIGVVDDDLPAAQCFDGNSEIVVAPAWRLPHSVRGREGARSFIGQQMRETFGATVHGVWDLGGAYHPSAGLTPEVVYPLAMEIDGGEHLIWLDIEDAIAARAALHDGHLRIVLWRIAHACGYLDAERP